MAWGPRARKTMTEGLEDPKDLKDSNRTESLKGVKWRWNSDWAQEPSKNEERNVKRSKLQKRSVGESGRVIAIQLAALLFILVGIKLWKS